MTFTNKQIEELSAPLKRENVKTRQQSGRNLSFVESWFVISEANRIFGFDGWDRETIEARCVSEREREVGASKNPGWTATYVVKVRVTVHPADGSAPIIREGFGTGHGIDRDLGQAHESAVKEGESDAGKRALMTFGSQFGLDLYDKASPLRGPDNSNAQILPATPPTRAPEAKPVTPAPEAPANTKAILWAKAAIVAVRGMSREALDEWEVKNSAIIVKLRTEAPEQHTNLIDTIRVRSCYLHPVNA